MFTFLRTFHLSSRSMSMCLVLNISGGNLCWSLELWPVRLLIIAILSEVIVCVCACVCWRWVVTMMNNNCVLLYLQIPSPYTALLPALTHLMSDQRMPSARPHMCRWTREAVHACRLTAEARFVMSMRARDTEAAFEEISQTPECIRRVHVFP